MHITVGSHNSLGTAAKEPSTIPRYSAFDTGRMTYFAHGTGETQVPSTEDAPNAVKDPTISYTPIPCNGNPLCYCTLTTMEVRLLNR